MSPLADHSCNAEFEVSGHGLLSGTSERNSTIRFKLCNFSAHLLKGRLSVVPKAWAWEPGGLVLFVAMCCNLEQARLTSPVFCIPGVRSILR